MTRRRNQRRFNIAQTLPFTISSHYGGSHYLTLRAPPQLIVKIWKGCPVVTRNKWKENRRRFPPPSFPDWFLTEEINWYLRVQIDAVWFFRLEINTGFGWNIQNLDLFISNLQQRHTVTTRAKSRRLLLTNERKLSGEKWETTLSVAAFILLMRGLNI